MSEKCEKPCVYEAFKTENGQGIKTPKLSIEGNAVFCDGKGCKVGIDLIDKNKMYGECTGQYYKPPVDELIICDTPVESSRFRGLVDALGHAATLPSRVVLGTTLATYNIAANKIEVITGKTADTSHIEYLGGELLGGLGQSAIESLRKGLGT